MYRLIILICIISYAIGSNHWISLGLMPPSMYNNLSHNVDCSKYSGLSKGQTQLCSLYTDHMVIIINGIFRGLQECKHQFKNMRWNCSFDDNSYALDKLVNEASREAGFTYAIATGGVVYAISRACRDGALSNCGCSKSDKPANLPAHWLWAGCGDNIEYGYKFSETFVDLREREREFNNGKDFKRKARRLMNLHNNEAGRRSVVRKSRVTCKCHGVSGSCSLITCWHQLPTFREIGDYLKSKYDASTRVKINRRGKLQVQSRRSSIPTPEDLVHIEGSPDYCVHNKALGSLGTKGRQCTRDCNTLCCGRGYVTRKTRVSTKCKCKFNWCCWVQCETCTEVRDITTCK